MLLFAFCLLFVVVILMQKKKKIEIKFVLLVSYCRVEGVDRNACRIPLISGHLGVNVRECACVVCV